MRAGPVRVFPLEHSPVSAAAADHAAAALLVSAFAQHWPDAWPTHADALSEIAEMRAADRVALAAWASPAHEREPAHEGEPTLVGEPALVGQPTLVGELTLVGEPTLVGLIGAIPTYDGRVWELHPLAVADGWRGQGVGRALVSALEAAVRGHGALVLVVGTDDEADLTTVSGADVFDAPWRHLRDLAQRPGRDPHPFAFYQRLGFVVTGIVPDANGRGKPDILMSKRL
jgi:aminoglycoside 6'-N-acetyltransferase I